MTNVTNFKNKHDGERAFFVGAGPSLSETPLEAIEAENTFACNNISKIYDETDWRPDYYTYIRNYSPKKEDTIINGIADKTTAFLMKEWEDELEPHEDIVYLERKIHKDPRIECFREPETIPDYAYKCWSDDVQDIIYLYNNSIYPVFQLVNYMGFDELYLVGCDLGIDTDWYPIFEDALEPKEFMHDFEDQSGNIEYLRKSDKKVKSFINGLAFKFPALFEAFYRNESHFKRDYLGKTAFIKRGTDAAQRRCHRLGRIKLQERDVDVYNATIGGKLEIHPRVNISEILNKG